MSFLNKRYNNKNKNTTIFNITTLVLVLLQLCNIVYGKSTDFYKLLGISRDATHKEIKKAYRQKSLEYHPDKNKDEGAADKFAEIARAYEVLTDEDKKEIYDRHGEEGLKQHEQRGGGGGGGHPMDDIFSQFGFNPFGNRGGGRQRDDQQRTPSIEMPLHLSLKQLYLGETIDVQYVRQVLCLNWEMCMKTNQECSGPGVRVVRQQLAPGFVQQVQQRDERCIARGKMWHKNCKHCPKQTDEEKIDLTIDVNPGYRNGERISFEGVTDEKPGHVAGDLHFVIHEEHNPNYHREKDDLYKTMEIPLVDALTGFEIELIHLDGKKFNVTVNEVTDCDFVLRVFNKGMPRRNGRPGSFGDLYITFEVDFPETLTDEQKKAIKQILGKPDDNDEKTKEDSSKDDKEL